MTADPPVPVEAPRYSWYHMLSAVIFIVFCLELGMALLVYPWSAFWDRGIFRSLRPEWRMIWDNTYLRGAASGLGVLNLYISLVEIFRLRRFVRRSHLRRGD
jgi:hypothetical protein